MTLQQCHHHTAWGSEATLGFVPRFNSCPKGFSSIIGLSPGWEKRQNETKISIGPEPGKIGRADTSRGERENCTCEVVHGDRD